MAEDQTDESQRCRPRLERAEYAELYGPTAGDRVRLADTDLWIEITDDRAGGPENSGNEMVFGGGKMTRESMGQAAVPREPTAGEDGTSPNAAGAPDTIITGVIILDHWGIIKADVALRNGRIWAVGKAYNPETMKARYGATPKLEDGSESLPGPPTIPADDPDGEPVLPPTTDEIDPPAATDIVVGAETEVISGNGKILTAGGVDTHVHFVCPEELNEALASGVTTLIGGGTGPAEGSKGTTVTPGSWHLASMFEALDDAAVNIGLLGKGSTTSEVAMREQLEAGVMGFKVHEDWGATPEVLRACLDMCEKSGVQLALHSDTLNEAGSMQSTRKEIKDHCIHAFHIEGAGGGHAPDMMALAAEPKVLPASTNPTRPLTVNTVTEHVDMVMAAHHLNPQVKEDLAFADSRIRPTTMAAEDLLHDVGAISIMSSDAQAMGRIGEMVLRTWQTAHVMKQQRGDLLTGESNDNARARRYVAKYTINPAIAHGIDYLVGSVETGKLADLVLWEPKFFGVKPHIVIKGGQIAYAQTGDANGSVTTPQPILPRPIFGAIGKSPGRNSVNFVSKAFFSTAEAILTSKKVSPNNKPFVRIADTRKLTKAHMSQNRAMPNIEIKPDSYQVTITGSGGENEEDDKQPDAFVTVKKTKTTDNTPRAADTGAELELEESELEPEERVVALDSRAATSVVAVDITAAEEQQAGKDDEEEIVVDYRTELPMTQRYFLF